MDDTFRETLKHELLCEHNCKDQSKDIVIIVRDQLHYIQSCVDSIYENTQNFKLYIWDNASDDATREYLQEISARDEVYLDRSEENLGFVLPNNYLAKKCQSPYIILLNSDTEVYEGWDRALIGCLQNHPEIKEAGYQGGLLNETGLGVGIGFGIDIDYIAGWCACFSLDTYQRYGLFDEERFKFAYFEDADFSLRLKEAGHDVYALNLNYVLHHGGATSLQVRGEMDMDTPFRANHATFGKRWSEYLRDKRTLHKPELTPT